MVAQPCVPVARKPWPPLPLLSRGPSGYAQVFLNTALFLSFRRISECAWHPCDLGGGGL